MSFPLKMIIYRLRNISTQRTRTKVPTELDETTDLASSGDIFAFHIFEFHDFSRNEKRFICIYVSVCVQICNY